MRRREFITLLGGAAAAWPRAARAQQGERVRHIGVFMDLADGDPEGQARVTALKRGLQDLGWIEGRNLRIESRWAAGEAARMKPLSLSVPSHFPPIAYSKLVNPVILLPGCDMLSTNPAATGSET